jgi:hypothetical protein
MHNSVTRLGNDGGLKEQLSKINNIAITGSDHRVMSKSLRSKQECGQDAVRKVAAPACLSLHASVSSIHIGTRDRQHQVAQYAIASDQSLVL